LEDAAGKAGFTQGRLPFARRFGARLSPACVDPPAVRF
jgi:hypothetical protein